MRGGIYTKEHCPICGDKFKNTGHDLICPEHKTRPRRVFIHIYNREIHDYVNITSDPDTRKVFSSYDQAERLLSVIRHEIDGSGDFNTTKYVGEKLKPYLFRNWGEGWLKRREIEAERKRISPSYLKELRRYIYKYHIPFFGDMDIRNIRAKTISDYYLSLRGASHYVKNILDSLHKMLRDALAWEDIKVLPAFPKVEVEEAETKIIDLEQQDKIIDAIQDRMGKAFVLFTAREMVRPSETRALCREDLDFVHNRVVIRRHFSLNQIRIATKAKQIKELPLDFKVVEALKSLPRHLTSPFVFWKKNGQPFSESWARKLWNETAKGLGLGKVSFYQGTRHSSATEATNRVGIDAVQEFLHHTNRKMTQRYVKANPDRLRKVLRGQ